MMNITIIQLIMRQHRGEALVIGSDKPMFIVGR
jgi:hypothetical protein